MSMYSVDAINNFRHQARSVVRQLGLLNDAFCDIGVTLAERHLLIELNAHALPLTMKEVGLYLLLEKSTVSRLIAKAIKKGFIQSSLDNTDRRKRYLHLTPHGKKTLQAFEEIAFTQTKNALLTLTPEQVGIVQKGMTLYAKGLYESRQNHLTQEPRLNMPIHPGFVLNAFAPDDEDALYSLFQDVVGADGYFPNESDSFEEFHSQFFSSGSQVYTCTSLTTGQIVAGFYIKPNFTGRGAHTANAAYMVANEHRGKGLGTKLIEASLTLAQKLTYKAMQYNMVLSSNTKALMLYKKLGFSIIGTVPEAIRNRDGSYQDGYILHKKLV